ncbi:hypothetical protein ACA910_013889 [Epithemia clementina (nom. ined.)]
MFPTALAFTATPSTTTTTTTTRTITTRALWKPRRIATTTSSSTTARRWNANPTDRNQHDEKKTKNWFFATPVVVVNRSSSTGSTTTDNQAATNRETVNTTTTFDSQTDSSITSTTTIQRPRLYRLVFLGTPSVAAATLQTLYDASLQSQQQQQQQQQVQQQQRPLLDAFEIVGVVTQPPKRRRKKGSSTEQSPVGKLAQALQLPLYTPDRLTTTKTITTTMTTQDTDATNNFVSHDLPHVLQPDLCVTAAYGQYLPKQFLATPKFGTVNIHPSLLPKWRGASPVQRSLQYGDNPVGVTLLYTVAKMDAGPMIVQHAETIDPDTDTALDVLPRLFDIGTQLLVKDVLPAIWNQTMTPERAQPQDESQVTLAPLIQHSNEFSEGELDLTQMTARQCHNLWRGFIEWPGVHLWVQVGPPPPPPLAPRKDDDNDNGDDVNKHQEVDPQQGPLLKVKIIESRVVSDEAVVVEEDPEDQQQQQEDENNNNNNHQKNHNSHNDMNAKNSILMMDERRILRLGPNKKKDGLYVTCADGSILELVKVQPPTKRPFPSRDLQNGYPNQVLYWKTPDEARQQQQQQLLLLEEQQQQQQQQQQKQPQEQKQ